jgi:glyoxylase-like metal-dependent hydrolase (beta-lactamase superfamily II)
MENQIEVVTLTFNPFAEQTYLVYQPNGEGVIIDPGCYTPEEKVMLREAVSKANFTPVAVWNTHCHIDHVLGNAFACKTWGIPLGVPKGEQGDLQGVLNYGPTLGIFPEPSPIPEQLFLSGQTLTFSGVKVEVIGAAGHSRDGVCFYFSEFGLLFGGDVLFYDSIGRTDLPGGNLNTLLNNIHLKLLVLRAEVKVYPGHGDPTTIGREKKFNPFLQTPISR